MGASIDLPLTICPDIARALDPCSAASRHSFRESITRVFVRVYLDSQFAHEGRTCGKRSGPRRPPEMDWDRLNDENCCRYAGRISCPVPKRLVLHQVATEHLEIDCFSARLDVNRKLSRPPRGDHRTTKIQAPCPSACSLFRQRRGMTQPGIWRGF